MRTILFIVISILLLAACNKSISNKVVITSTRTPDTFTVTDNGVTYTDIEDTLYGMVCREEIFNDGPFFELSNNNAAAFPIFIGIFAPVNGIGIYKIAPIDSNASPVYHQIGYLFTESFNGGEAYNVDSLIFNITTDTAITIIGNYQLWLSNDSGNKMVTGTISCHHVTHD